MSPLSYNISLSIAAAFRVFASRPAVSFSADKQLTYEQLDKFSNRAANSMIQRGIRKGDRVAICLEKTPSAYILPLAALKIGAPYLFLDPRNPPARLSSILEQCQPSILFHHSSYAGHAVPNGVVCPDTFELPEFVMHGPVGLPTEAEAVTGSDPAYIMFTSGSTGFPKGAVISHDNLIHFIEWIRASLRFAPEDVHTHLNPLHFDNSVFDLYSTLFTGGVLVPFDHATLQNPSSLVRRLAESRCTVWFSVPSLLMFLQTMKLATQKELCGLKTVMFGGEGYPKARLKELFEQIGGQTEILNVYGPTECTCICSCYRITEDDFRELEGFPPIGQLNQNFSCLLMNGDVEAVAGEPGELYLGGSCVGLGYFAQPKLTAKAFVQNPLNADYREIVYRTGDLLRYEPAEGKLHFVGRCDSQIKHMGYRIELEEIQHALSTIDGVDEAVALQRKAFGLSEIIAVIATTQNLAERDVRRHLAARLPSYMIPSRVHSVAQMPKNANGKTDRPALIRQYAS